MSSVLRSFKLSDPIPLVSLDLPFSKVISERRHPFAVMYVNVGCCLSFFLNSHLLRSRREKHLMNGDTNYHTEWENGVEEEEKEREMRD